MKQGSNAVVGGIFGVAAAIIIELESRIQQKLVRQLLVCQPARQRCVCSADCTDAPAPTDSPIGKYVATLLVEFFEFLCACNLGQLQPQTLNLCPELDAELGIAGFIYWEIFLCLVEGHQSVLDTTSQLRLVWNFPRLEIP